MNISKNVFYINTTFSTAPTLCYTLNDLPKSKNEISTVICPPEKACNDTQCRYLCVLFNVLFDSLDIKENRYFTTHETPGIQ